MIIDISDNTFKNIFDDEKLFLPLKWDGIDFLTTIEKLYKHYINKLEKLSDEHDYKYIRTNIFDIKSVCGLIRNSIEYYLDGFPSKAYYTFDEAMRILMDNQLKIYEKLYK